MPRTSNVYSPPAGTKGTPNTTIESSKYNALIDDLTTDANAARPITAGGTGATNATAARVALGADNADNITKGTVAEARLPSTFAGVKTFANSIIATGGSIELGRVDGVASTPFIDFHSGTAIPDYDVRLIADGGNGANGGGSLSLLASTFTWGGFSVVRANGLTWSISITGNAGTLGGQSAAYYTNIPARLGYAPVNKSGDTGLGTMLVGTSSIGTTVAPGAIELCATSPFIDLKNNGSDDYDVRLGMDGTINAFTVTAAGGGFINGTRIVVNAGTYNINVTGDAGTLNGQNGSYYRNLGNSTGVLPNARISGDYDGIDYLTSNRLRLLSTNDASDTSTGHAFQVGLTSSLNVIMDINEMIVRNNGAYAGDTFNFRSAGIFSFTATNLVLNGNPIARGDGGTYSMNISGTAAGANNAGNADNLGGVAASAYLRTANLRQEFSDIGVNEIGSIAIMSRTAAGTLNQGDTSLGSALRYSNFDGTNISGTSPFGTWMLLSRVVGGNNLASVGLFKRIS